MHLVAKQGGICKLGQIFKVDCEVLQIYHCSLYFEQTDNLNLSLNQKPFKVTFLFYCLLTELLRIETNPVEKHSYSAAI